MTDWRSMTGLELLEDGGVRARFRARADSPWFEGHFPGEPVLPGIAQLSMAFEAAEKARGEKLTLRGLRRVRFKKVIRPGDSGGGVWQQGTLVGTMWSTVEEQLHFGDNPGPVAGVTTRRSLAAGLTACLLRLLDQSLANRQVISDVPAGLSVE